MALNLPSAILQAPACALFLLYEGEIFSSTTIFMRKLQICSILMQKAGDVSNAFIRDDAYAALDEVVKNASPMKVLSGLIASGSKYVMRYIKTTECEEME